MNDGVGVDVQECYRQLRMMGWSSLMVKKKKNTPTETLLHNFTTVNDKKLENAFSLQPRSQLNKTAIFNTKETNTKATKNNKQRNFFADEV